MRSLPAVLLLIPGLAFSSASLAGNPAPEIRVLQSAELPQPEAVIGGALDSNFTPFVHREARQNGGPFWLRITWEQAHAPEELPSVVVRKGRHFDVQLYSAGKPLPRAASLPAFSGVQEAVFVKPGGMDAGQPLYARIEPIGRGAEELAFSRSTLERDLARSTAHERMIALAFGALMSLAIGALLIWFVLEDRLFVLYAALFSLQALYIVYLSGYGFEWPLLRLAAPLSTHAWNVPVALSGAAACLFVREIADLKRYSPRVYRSFGWIAWAFVVLTFANVGYSFGLGPIVAAAGNLLFVGAAAYTLFAAFMAWRRGSRAAGWFLVAWGMLEVVTIAAAVRMLVSDPPGAETLLYYVLPLAMVGAAVFIALGVADRMREQRAALTEAERRAQTDPLTGVLNRRSIVERLEAACVRARARALPISLLFIDLDHFKEINDTFGHAAGDACLHAIIKPIQAELRQSDVVGRYGGEEFVVILSSADVTAARPIAERIRARVAETRVEGFGPPIQLTCSIGVATSDMLGVWGESLIARADAAVYAAKKSGRNRVQVAMPMAA